ncbi:MAG: molybdopterin-dependent oxidoreductase [Chloroflexi bacterium]|nr:molybdopterin-dependent oxidoreductase [Chloroflexota bacterium]
MEEYAVVGKRLPRVDGPVKATGGAVYAADISLPGMLFGKMLRSPYAHARILNIDYSQALKLPGVRAVCTGKDFPGIKYGFLPSTRDQLPMATDKVRHYGEAVAAISEDIAEEALDLIVVDYKELPVVLTATEAMREGAPLVHEEHGSNIAATTRLNFGDVEKGFRESDLVREESFTTERVSVGFIEPHAVVASVDASGNVTLQGSKQSPYITWRHFCRAMDLPLSKVKVINPYVGGGFSGKHEPFDLDFAATVLSRKTGLPVKIVLSQDEVISSFKQRHHKDVWIKVGMKKDGMLVACDCRLINEGGAYASVGPYNMVVFTLGLVMPYRISHLRYEAHRIYTNKPWCGAVRGQSVPVARYAFEALMHRMINELGLDQVETRRKNAIRQGDTTINGMKIDSCGLDEAIDKAAGMVNWEQHKRQRLPNRGVGFACTSMPSGTRMGGHYGCAAVVKIDEDGGVSLLHGGTEIGQGCDTVLAQMAAEVLGVSLDDVRVIPESTDTSVLEAGMYGSRCTFWSGNAVKAAAEDARRQLAEIASPLLKTDKEDLVFRGRKVFPRGREEKAVPLLDIVRQAYYSRGQPIYGRGSWAANDIDLPDMKTGSGNIAHGWGFFAQAVEVEVDPKTGQVKLLKSVCARDAGRPINPLTLDGQVEGGTVFTSGQALWEECQFDEKGIPLQSSFADYKMPTIRDAPLANLNHDIITNDPWGPFGAKGAGESSNSTTLAAIANAVQDATGMAVNELPVRPEKVLAALKKRERRP